MALLTEKEKNKILDKELREFQKQYPLTTSADLQTFILAWRKGWEAYDSILNQTK